MCDKCPTNCKAQHVEMGTCHTSYKRLLRSPCLVGILYIHLGGLSTFIKNLFFPTTSTRFNIYLFFQYFLFCKDQYTVILILGNNESDFCQISLANEVAMIVSLRRKRRMHVLI